MDDIQFFTLLGTFLAASGFIYKEFRLAEDKIEKASKNQSARTDKLYEMFIDLLKAK
jgi:hypothetical protein|uniref:Uncharacterized protein n=1 Tax=uncultured Caudovirales phage TaxID=2100421 RepID=A0A6J5KVF9_9CAUD|nr:hypothetical protein UFOVP88_40 [uncultured Caudovirales phage]